MELLEVLLEGKTKTRDYRDALCEDCRCLFVEDTVSEFWGRGSTNQGLNTLGCLHVLTRCKLWLGTL